MAKLKKRKNGTVGSGRSKKPKAPTRKQEDDPFGNHGNEDLDSEQEGSEREEEDAVEENETDDEENKETAEQKRLRIAKAYLDRIRKSVGTEEDGDDDERNLGNRDSLVADLLKQQQLEESGRAQRHLAARVVKPVEPVKGRYVSRRHRQSVTAVALTEDDSRGFAASKDGMIVHWDVEAGMSDKYEWPAVEVSSSGKNTSSQPKGKRGGKQQGGSRHVLALAVSSDGRFLASGGLDRTVHVWDTRTREHIQAFPGHKGAVSSLAFRLGTHQLMSGAYDRTVKLWSVEDRSYIDTLFGHQSEVVFIDCLRQERVLSAGRDRTLRLWKIPEESQLVFRGHAPSIESCCMISNGEFLSGSDDGSIALWSILRKKPVYIVKNAHGCHGPEDNSTDLSNLEKPSIPPCANGPSNSHSDTSEGDQIPPGVCIGAGVAGAAKAWVGAVAVCRSSDLAASGAADGTVRLWALEDGNKSLRALQGLPVDGFINSLKFAYSGRFLLAGVGQEPRLGRWGHVQSVWNGVVMHTLGLTN